MHKLTRPNTDCPKCGCEDGFPGVPKYREIIGSADGISGMMVWECWVCGYERHTKPYDEHGAATAVG